MEKSSASGSVKQSLSNGRFWDWKAVLLALAIVEISSLRLVATEWVPFLYFTQTMGFVGFVVGLALGYSSFSRQVVVRFVAGYTLLLFLLHLQSAVEKTGWLWQDILTVLDRLFISLDQFIQNKPVYDHLFFISIVTLIYWLIGLSAGYWLTRHGNYLNVVLPSGLAIITVQAFDSVQSKLIWEMAFFICSALLLMGRMHFLQNHSFWRKNHFLLTDEALNDLERGTLVITAIAVFLAWSMPGWIRGIGSAAQVWKELSQPIFDKYSNAVSALDSPYTDKNADGDFYSNALALGQKAALGDTPVFTVDLRKRQFTPARSYWKGRVYDFYHNGQWTTVSDSSKPFSASIDEITVEYPNARHETEFTFTSNVKLQNLLYAPEETVWVSKNAEIHGMSIATDKKDVTAWVATTSLLSGNQYKVRALIADPSIEELRSAGSEYPGWVTDRYLQIPEEIAPQLRELTTRITANHDTIYDKVQAVTSYLRKEIEYDTKIEKALPENRDPVLWVLFEYKKGFCMYYASAETLMLRSIGIPARMAVGFVEGAYDELKRQYVVTYKDSHAWPEVYFPGIGWVEFEPTGNQFPIERPETNNNFANPTTPASKSERDLTANPQSSTLKEAPKFLSDTDIDSSAAIYQKNLYEKFMLPLFALLALGFGIFAIRRYSLNDRLPVYLAQQYERRGYTQPCWLYRWVRWVRLSQIERAFQTINLSLFWLGQPQPAHITSQKRAEVLIKCLPSAQDQTLSLLQEYHNAMYTPREGNLATAQKAAFVILLKTWQTRIKKSLQSGNTRYNQLK